MLVQEAITGLPHQVYNSSYEGGWGDVHTHTHEEYEAQGEEADELREETGHDAVEGRASETAGPGGAQPPMTARKRTRKQQAADDRTRKKPRTGDG